MNTIQGLMRVVTLFTGFMVALGLFTSQAHARDLQGRLGLGYNAQFANYRETGGVPAIAGKYAFTNDLALEGIVGVATSTPGNSVFGVKFFKNLFFETNLNFYSFVGVALVAANNRSSSNIQGGFGTEFFIPGLESLGLSMELGAELTGISGSTVLRTLGISFLHAGMRFYF